MGLEAPNEDLFVEIPENEIREEELCLDDDPYNLVFARFCQIGITPEYNNNRREDICFVLTYLAAFALFTIMRIQLNAARERFMELDEFLSLKTIYIYEIAYADGFLADTAWLIKSVADVYKNNFKALVNDQTVCRQLASTLREIAKKGRAGKEGKFKSVEDLVGFNRAIEDRYYYYKAQTRHIHTTGCSDLGGK